MAGRRRGTQMDSTDAKKSKVEMQPADQNENGVASLASSSSSALLQAFSSTPATIQHLQNVQQEIMEAIRRIETNQVPPSSLNTTGPSTSGATGTSASRDASLTPMLCSSAIPSTTILLKFQELEGKLQRIEEKLEADQDINRTTTSTSIENMKKRALSAHEREEKMRDEIDELKRALDVSNRDCHRLKRQLETANEDVSELEASNTTMRAERRAEKAEYERLKKEHSELHQQQISAQNHASSSTSSSTSSSATAANKAKMPQQVPIAMNNQLNPMAGNEQLLQPSSSKHPHNPAPTNTHTAKGPLNDGLPSNRYQPSMNMDAYLAGSMAALDQYAARSAASPAGPL